MNFPQSYIMAIYEGSPCKKGRIVQGSHVTTARAVAEWYWPGTELYALIVNRWVRSCILRQLQFAIPRPILQQTAKAAFMASSVRVDSLIILLYLRIYLRFSCSYKPCFSVHWQIQDFRSVGGGGAHDQGGTFCTSGPTFERQNISRRCQILSWGRRYSHPGTTAWEVTFQGALRINEGEGA